MKKAQEYLKETDPFKLYIDSPYVAKYAFVSAINTARKDVLDELEKKVKAFGANYVLTIQDTFALITELKNEIE